MIKIDFDKGSGLVPCIVQDEQTGKVLMLGYMSEESLQKTLETGLAEDGIKPAESLDQRGNQWSLPACP